MRCLLPLPPSVNRTWRNLPGLVDGAGKIVCRGRTLLSVDARVYRQRVAWLLRTQGAVRFTPEHGPLLMAVMVYWPDRRRRDGDNLWKSLKDALQSAGVFEDDTQVKRHIMDESDEIYPGGAVFIVLDRRPSVPAFVWTLPSAEQRYAVLGIPAKKGKA